MNRVSALLITADANTSRAAAEAVRAILPVDIVRSVSEYPSNEDLARILHVHTPAVVFLDCMHVQAATCCASLIQRCAPGVITVGIRYDPDAVLHLLRSGVRELLTLPLPENRGADEAILNILRLLTAYVPTHSAGGNIVSFLPAKAGVGASVVAVNTAIAIAADRRDQRVLLCDCDTSSGIAAFLMKVPPEHSFRSALEVAEKLDEDLWRNLVTRRGSLDIIGPGTLAFPHNAKEYESVERILAFATRLYDTIVIDFSGAIEPSCVAIMRQSQHVFVVVTQETPALHLARAKVQALVGMQLDQRLSVVLNRFDSTHPVSTGDVEELVQMPVRQTFVNDYKAVNAAIIGDGRVNASSRLGRQFRDFALMVSGPCPAPVVPAERRRFFGLFSFTPGAFRLAVDERTGS